jgi:PKD repeat protein
MKKLLLLSLTCLAPFAGFAAGHTVTLSASPASCAGSCDGSITSVVSGGTGPFTYAWSPSGGTNSSMTGACAGTYTLTVTDVSDASTTIATAVVTQPAAISVTFNPVHPCGICNGSITVTAGGPYTYSWIGPSGFTAATQNISGRCAGTYTCNVSYAGCVTTSTTTLFNVPGPTVTVPSSYNACSGSCVTLAATAGGTVGPYNFTWGPAAGLSATSIANPVSCVATTTTYTVTVADANGCTASANTTVNVVPTPMVSISTTNSDECACNGTATSSVTGGTGPYTYMWSDGSTVPNPNGLCAGNYSVSITDNMGCNVEDSITIMTIPAVIANFTLVPDSLSPNSFWVFNSSTGPSLYNLWDFGDGYTANVPAPTHTYGSPGTYNVCLSLVSFVCGDDTVCQDFVAGPPAACLALFNIGDDTVSSNPDDHYVYNLSYGSSLSYFWDFGDGTTSTLASPSHIYSGSGPYQLCLTVDNGSGCTETYCDTLFSADSLNRSGNISITVYDVPAPLPVSTSISEELNFMEVMIVPHPFSDMATVNLSGKISSEYDFVMYDVLGKTVMNINDISDTSFNINRNGLSEGIYFYRIIGLNSDLQGKIMIK